MTDSKTKMKPYTSHTTWNPPPPTHTCTQTLSRVREKRFLLLSFLSQWQTTLQNRDIKYLDEEHNRIPGTISSDLLDSEPNTVTALLPYSSHKKKQAKDTNLCFPLLRESTQCFPTITCLHVPIINNVHFIFVMVFFTHLSVVLLKWFVFHIKKYQTNQ